MTTAGQRFSLVYLERGAPTRDSERLRKRLSSWAREHISYKSREELVKLITIELGVSHPSFGDYFEEGELRDVLDAITLTYGALKRSGYRDAGEWTAFVSRAMREENVGYRLDPQGGVHFAVDQEFERNREATIAALGSDELVAARTAHEDAYRYLDGDPPDTKAAVRSIFEAVEILAKQVVQDAARLNRSLIVGKLKTAILASSPHDATEQSAIAALVDGMVSWAEGLHFYRHGQRQTEPVAPSLDFAVHALSVGSVYARQLAPLARGAGNIA